ncbi:hypothetical protein ABZX66_20930 [Micromonospora aurantiaca]|uniref:hypothetical protein n=1 Tax=Micromonospora aurantiaca (nom. illeg.) TaxID=47850 RepID=UPI0033B5DE21
MHVTYSPADGETQRWEFDPGKVRASQAELIEKRFGGNWDSFRTEVQAGSIRARRVLLWHLLTREHHTLRFEDTPDFYAGELVVEHSAQELGQLKDRLMKANLADSDREQMLIALDIEISEAIARGEQMEGKAISNSAD